MTEAATRFVTPLTFGALSGRPAHVDLWQQSEGTTVPHIQLARTADLVIIAPLSANTLAKLACGLADNLLTSTLLAVFGTSVDCTGDGVAYVGAPGDTGQPGHAGVAWVPVVGPGAGRLASGAEGVGRMAEPTEILMAARQLLARNGALAGLLRVGDGRWHQEPLDPVRFLTNASSARWEWR